MATLHRSHASAPPVRVSAGAVLALALLVLALTGLLPLLQTTQTTSTGFTVSQLEARRDELLATVQRLEVEIASLTSLDRVEREAQAVGFVEPAETVLLEVDQPGSTTGAAPPAAGRSLSIAGEETESGPAWWQRLLAFFDVR